MTSTDEQGAPSDVMFGYLLAGVFSGAVAAVLVGFGVFGDVQALAVAGYGLAGLAGFFLTIWTIAVGVMLGLRAHAREL